MENLNPIVAKYLDYILKANALVSHVDATFKFIGDYFTCDRIYIFEFNEKGSTMDNTYEWCANGVIPQKDMLQDEPLSTIEAWLREFREGKTVIIYDLEEIKEINPTVYAGLKPQNITSLITSAILDGGKIIGFIGVDNPLKNQIDEIVDFLSYISPYILKFIERSNRLKELDYICYHDKLTGALSRQALELFETQGKQLQSVGILHCDLTNIRNFSQYQSPSEIDMVVHKIYKLLREIFPFDNIYRIWGVKFVVACVDISKDSFGAKFTLLNTLLKRHDFKVFMGRVWSEKNINISKLLLHAERDMYQERIRNKTFSERPELLDNTSGSNEFLHFIKNNYFNTEVVLNSITSLGTNYLYFGDLQTNIFYVSDNMRDTFGFESNIVPDLPSKWEKFIANREDLNLYREDIQELFLQHKDIHDLRYRVKDINDNSIWIHCKGYVHWNEDHTIPLFFSGSFTSQEHDFVIDLITNFPKETAAATKLQDLHNDGRSVTMIGFGLNNFSEINELKGRTVGDRLLGDIALNLSFVFEDKLQFYRLDGVRFAGIVSIHCQDAIEEIVEEIHNIVGSHYKSHMIAVKRPCSIAVINTNPKDNFPFEIVSNIISLISIAKNSPEDDFVMHTPESLEKQHRHAEIVMELSNNVENNFENFRIVIQPTVLAESRTIAGGEVLLRWKFKDKDVSPDVFIEILEKNRLINSVGRWVFEQTVRVVNRIISMNPELYLSFNVSYLQILDPSFVHHMQSVIRTYQVDPARLVLELTETHFDDSPQKLQEFFEMCRAMNMNIALDDFGKGYSSLGLLLKYPTQVVKLDRSILNEMSNSEDNQKFVASVVYACHAFGKKVCAEGVETSEESNIMKNAECDLLQGYHFSKPLEIEDFYRLIAEKTKL